MDIISLFNQSRQQNLTSVQKQLVEMFKSKTSMEQAEQIAKLCNEKGITKDDLIKLINGLKGK